MSHSNFHYLCTFHRRRRRHQCREPLCSFVYFGINAPLEYYHQGREIIEVNYRDEKKVLCIKHSVCSAPGVIASSPVIVAMYHLLKLKPLKVCYGVLCLLVNTLSSFSNLSVKATAMLLKLFWRLTTAPSCFQVRRKNFFKTLLKRSCSTSKWLKRDF